MSGAFLSLLVQMVDTVYRFPSVGKTFALLRLIVKSAKK
jgi:hypothetical protein